MYIWLATGLVALFTDVIIDCVWDVEFISLTEYFAAFVCSLANSPDLCQVFVDCTINRLLVSVYHLVCCWDGLFVH